MVHRLRVRWVDTDASGRIHNTAAFRYFEETETELFRAIGGRFSAQAGGYDFPRVHVECDYLSPLGFDDVVEIEPRVERIGETSFTLAYTARIVESGPFERLLTDGRQRALPVTALRGRMVIVCVDTRTGGATPLPHELRAALETFRTSAESGPGEGRGSPDGDRPRGGDPA